LTASRASGEFGYLDLLDVKDGPTIATIKRGKNAGYDNAYTCTSDGKTVISGGGRRQGRGQELRQEHRD
jgi:hypothetical protein